MAYVLKNEHGQIIATSPSVAPDSQWEFVENDDKNYIAFLEEELATRSTFRESDIQLARVLEDLISILIERGLIQYTDFPSAAQKTFARPSTLASKKQPHLVIGRRRYCRVLVSIKAIAKTKKVCFCRPFCILHHTHYG